MQAQEPQPEAMPTMPGSGSFGGLGTANELAALAESMPTEADGNAIDDRTASAEPVAAAPEQLEVSSTFFSRGSTATRSVLPQISLVRGYRPKQRTSLPTPDDATPTVPAGWKSDPTGRHQFRYWDGFHWTENVADAGEQSNDALTS
jgi:hypothetical protein